MSAVAEWRLFADGEIPVFTQPAFFAKHPWVDPVGQRGHAQRTDLVADLVADVVRGRDLKSVVDLGCGDGALLQKILRRVRVDAWGYDLGLQNIHVGRTLRCVDVRPGDILNDTGLEYGELVVATEVVEHLLDPYSFVRGLPGTLCVLSSPWDENDFTHYEHHAWAWDRPGYRQMIESCGWTVVDQRHCKEGFQAVLAERLS